MDQAGGSREADLVGGKWGITSSVSVNIISFSCVTEVLSPREMRLRD